MGHNNSKDQTGVEEADETFQGGDGERLAEGGAKRSKKREKDDKKLKEWMEAERADFGQRWSSYEANVRAGNPGTQAWPLAYDRYGGTVTSMVNHHFGVTLGSAGRGSSSRDSITCLADLELIRTLGEGSFGRVILVKVKAESRRPVYYATKVQNKARLARTKQVKGALTEKRVLWCVRGFPFVVAIAASFKDNSNLYMVLEYVSGGELFTHLRKVGRFTEVQAAFYAAQVFLALEYMHGVDLLYRDLKPENVLVTATGYLKVADFGFTKMAAATSSARTYTFCGTPDYMAPEIVANRGYGKGADWWAFGVLLFEMCAGYAPFSKMAGATDPGNGDQTGNMFRNVCQGNYTFPTEGIAFSGALKDLIGNLLRVETVRRYGCLRRGTRDVSGHAWFGLNGVNSWTAIYGGKAKAPIVPKARAPGDASNFGRAPKESPLEIGPVDECGDLFAEF